MGEPVDLWSTYKIPLVLGAVSIILVALSISLLVKSAQTTTPIRFSEDEVATGSALGASMVAVDVEGAVNHPGLYSLPAGSRIEDAILAAGGLSTKADLAILAKTINRAAKVVDGGKLYIPLQGDTLQKPSGQSIFISINSASESELESLPGVGPVTAKKIIDNRPYQTLEELVSTKALGQSLFDKLKDKLTL